MTMTLDGTNGVTFNDSSLQGAAASPYVLKNRIINGAMVIDQRNAGASVTATTSAPFSVDRWQLYSNPTSKFTAQQVSGNANTTQGYDQSLKITSSSAYTITAGDSCIVQQPIEGNNIVDLAFGTAGAKTVTLSFWVYSSLTGTFGGSLQNYAGTRSYPFSYTISTANTWEQKSITIAGDTSGTWVGSSNAGSMTVVFGLGVGSTRSGTVNTWASANYYAPTGATSVVGTSGATWYLVGVQLEIGSTATPFERRLYNAELAACQRYYAKSYAQGTVPGATTNLGLAALSSGGGGSYTDLLTVSLPVIMRTTVTVSFWDTVGNSSKITRLIANSSTTNSTGSSAFESDRAFSLYGSSGVANANGLYAHWVASAEL